MNERESMLTAVLDCERIDLYAKPKMLTFAQENKYEEMLKRRSLGEPLQYIIGHANFMGLKIKVTPAVLIPRPETEILVDEALKVLKDKKETIKVLDLGCGSGNIPIALAKFIDTIEITTVDVSLESLKLAQENAELNGVGHKIKFIHEDMSVYLAKDTTQKFDLIISNPPYIKTSDISNLPNDVRQEPMLALDGGSNGLNFYQVISHYAPRFLHNNGFLFLEIGDNQDKDVRHLLSLSHVFKNISFIKDYVGTNRVVVAQNN